MAVEKSVVPADIESRVDALEKVAARNDFLSDDYAEKFVKTTDEEWVSENGARLVARAWSDPEFKRRLLADGHKTMAEFGLSMPKHHNHLAVLENTPTVHNVICCSLCSCTAFTIIGLPPDWYKDLDYRARAVRESRTVLKEMGLTLAPEMEIRVWDTTADTRYMVLPLRPDFTEGWDEARLASIVTQNAMIGVERLEPPYSQPLL